MKRENGEGAGRGRKPLCDFPRTARAGTRYAMDRRLLSIVPHCVHVFPVASSAPAHLSHTPPHPHPFLPINSEKRSKSRVNSDTRNTIASTYMRAPMSVVLLDIFFNRFSEASTGSIYLFRTSENQ